ncbi:hypothetical protein [Pseudomonas sp.]|uniref:hypothetical protein n=1 Tax=Pseudomonas sp. TaxID=306 RepID=UPI0026137E34|nr:hypothetical protein [Pseudomonas sp.]
MTLDVLDFRAVLDKRGACFVANEGVTRSPQFAAPPTTNRRIDLLYLTQEISTIDGGTTQPVLRIRAGDPSPTPIRPTLPADDADALPLYAVEIPAGTTSMNSAGVILTPLFPYTAMAGGVVWVRNLVELAAWAGIEGSHAHVLSEKSTRTRLNGTWGFGLATAEPIMTAGWQVAVGLGYDNKIYRDSSGLCTMNTLLHALTGGIDSIFTAPPGFRPATHVFIGESRSVKTGSNLTGSIRMGDDGRASMPAGYYSGSSTADAYYPVSLMWRAKS